MTNLARLKYHCLTKKGIDLYTRILVEAVTYQYTIMVIMVDCRIPLIEGFDPVNIRVIRPYRYPLKHDTLNRGMLLRS